MGDQEKEPFGLAVTPEIEALTGQIVSRFTQAILSLGAERFGSLKELAQQVGCSATYLYKIQKEDRKLSFGLIARLIAVAGVPLEAFLRRLLELEWAGKKGIDQELTGSPAVLLAEWREPGAERDSPFLKSLGEALAELRTLEPAVLPPSSAWRSILLMLEEERLRDWRKTRRRLERYILRLARGRVTEGRVSRMDLSDLATLLAAWSAVQRVAGLRGFAIDGLTLAFELAERSGDVWAEGFCLQKAAYLSHDLGRDGMAAAMIRKAAVCFSEVGTPEDLARLAVDRGYFSYYCGKLDEAQRLFRVGLARLAGASGSHTRAALQGLAIVARTRGNLKEAIDYLEQAVKVCESNSLEAAHLRWSQAKIELAAKLFDSAESHCREAIGIFAKKGHSGDVALAAFELAEIYMVANRKAHLEALAGDLLNWLPSTTENAVVRREVENFIALARMRTATVNDLNSARQALGRAGVQVRLDL